MRKILAVAATAAALVTLTGCAASSASAKETSHSQPPIVHAEDGKSFQVGKFTVTPD